MLAIWPFYALGVAAIYRLRRRGPAAAARQRVGYPIVPAIFIVSVAWFVVNALVTRSDPDASLSR